MGLMGLMGLSDSWVSVSNWHHQWLQPAAGNKMTRNQQVSSCYAHLEAFAVPRFFQLRGLPRRYADFTEIG
jgi:hypothetical protein